MQIDILIININSVCCEARNNIKKTCFTCKKDRESYPTNTHKVQHFLDKFVRFSISWTNFFDKFFYVMASGRLYSMISIKIHSLINYLCVLVTTLRLLNTWYRLQSIDFIYHSACLDVINRASPLLSMTPLRGSHYSPRI